ncbi:Protein FMP25 mitochondrial [Ceratocystis lukuohia]|uniref:Protein FMP25 mitochondrial n=1 Tax=Ceratocystis lukuohia TaxID=2019550 RepID=A0ABR4MTE6_9PEZI
MPSLGAFRIPSAALRRATIAGSHGPVIPGNASQARCYASRRTTQRLAKTARGALAFGTAAAIVYYYPTIARAISGEPTEEDQKKLDRSRVKPTKAKLASQTLVSQTDLNAIPKSWDVPGLYVWGLNASKVADPNSQETYVRVPRRIKYFDGQLLRDVKLRHNFGAAVTERGDIVQWGKGFDKEKFEPTTTLKGKNIVKIAVSSDRIIALAANGGVYSLPASKTDLIADQRDLEAEAQKNTNSSGSWLPSFWSSSSASPGLAFRTITPAKLARGEKVTDISSGTDHCLLLTSAGRVFSAASSTSKFPAHGQLGVPGLTWDNRPSGPYYQSHEVPSLKDVHVVQIATGDRHSIVLDKDGQSFGFGDNMFGQLGMPNPSGTTQMDKPVKISSHPMYGRSADAKLGKIAAGGNNTFFAAANPGLPESVDVWAAGQGHLGSLGTGHWLHMTSIPSKMRALSGLTEFSDTTGALVPIRVGKLSVGATHSAAILDGASPQAGRDILVWGGNEHYQLGTGKRANLSAPSNIPPPSDGAEGTQVAESQRLQAAPQRTVMLDGKKRHKVSLKQDIECGEYITALYSTPS